MRPTSLTFLEGAKKEFAFRNTLCICCGCEASVPAGAGDVDAVVFDNLSIVGRRQVASDAFCRLSGGRGLNPEHF
jgi:hypothetical protein